MINTVFLVPMLSVIIDTVIEPFRKWTAVALGQNLKRDWIAEKLTIFQAKIDSISDQIPYAFRDQNDLFCHQYSSEVWESLFKSCEIIVGI